MPRPVFQTQWLKDPRLARSAYSLVFLVLFSVLETAIWLLGVTQLGFFLLTGQPNASLKKVGRWLSRYSADIIQYISHGSQQRPFPLKD